MTGSARYGSSPHLEMPVNRIEDALIETPDDMIRPLQELTQKPQSHFERGGFHVEGAEGPLEVWPGMQVFGTRHRA